MKTITKTSTYFLHASSYDKNELVIYSCDMTKHGDILLAEKDFEISIDVPENLDITQLEINGLNKEKEKIQAETPLKVQNIEDQIQRLLAIGHDEEGKQ